ncbi:MAG: class I SAM-dependent methyltransferase [Acidobacteriia bacterium]|nr:class I SAM-dependent methyltransferase [Terriglobia bacterium]
MKSAQAPPIAVNEIDRIRAEYQRRNREVPADFYSWSKPANYLAHSETCRALIAVLAAEGIYPLDGRKVLDVGCGSGTWLLELAQWHATELCGIDLDETRLAAARLRLPQAELFCGDATKLPWPDKTFDLITQFTVFTSVLNPAVKQALANEMLRVLKPSGVIAWYDFCFNNPKNPNVRGVKAAEIAILFPGARIRGRKVTLAPPIARLIAPVCWPLALLLEQMPFLRTHYLALIRKQ